MHSKLFSWVPVEGFQADVAFQLDQLSMTFVLLITGVGTLIHIYSVGYMEHDPGRRRFFGYLNLFLAAMLLLVLADNFLLLYVGWEGVGLASYLLIGFWQHKPSAATAAKKAFLVNRVGDAGLAVAIFLMFTTFGSFAFAPVLSSTGEAGEGTLTAIGLMLLLAACGKVRAGAAPVLAGRRDGGPDPGLGPHPRGDDGDRGRLPDHPVRCHLQRRPGRATRGGRRRRRHAALRCDRRLCEGRHQEGAGRLDHVADRLHDPGRRAGADRLRVRHHAPGHPRLLQGRALPRGRFGDARHERRGRHAALRRTAQAHAGHLRDVRAGLSGHHRLPGPVRVLSPRTRSSRPRSARAAPRAGSWARSPCWARRSPRTT